MDEAGSIFERGFAAVSPKPLRPIRRSHMSKMEQDLLLAGQLLTLQERW